MRRGTVIYPAVVSKADITPLAEKIGYTNSTIVSFDGGQPIKPGTLRFSGFAGALNIADGLYHGVYMFDPVAPGVESPDRFDFDELPKEVTA